MNDPREALADSGGIVLLLRGTLIIFSVLLLVNAVATESQTARALYLFLLAAFVVGAVSLRQSLRRPVAIGLFVTLVGAETLAVVLFGGLRSGTALTGYLVLIVLAGLIWSIRAGLATAMFAVVVTGVAGYLQAHSALPIQRTLEDQSLLGLWSGFTLLVFCTMGILYVAVTRLRDSAEESRLSGQRLAAVVDGAPNGMLVIDEEARVVSANPAAVSLIGRDREVLIGASLLDSFDFGREDRRAVSEGLAKALVGERVPNFEVEAGTSEPRVPVDILLSPFQSGDGLPAVLATLQDLTERRRSEAERDALEKQLRVSQKMEAIGRLAGGVAHDFNNLLTVIMGHSEDLYDNLDDRPEQQQNARTIQEAAEHAAALTRQLLAFSRLQPLQVDRFDLNERVGDMQRMLGRLIRDDVELQLDLASRPTWIEADSTQIEQVLANLIVNAQDSMPDGGRISVSTRHRSHDELDPLGDLQPGNYVVLTVEDEGTGISPEIRERIFEPFFTTKEVDKGTGLGLATVHGIVRQSGGDIHVASTMGAGTRFEVRLPDAHREGDPAPARSAPLVKAPDREASILVAEDAPAVRRFISKALSSKGFRVIEAEDGAEALKVLESGEPIDAVLTDIRMPNCSGVELLRRTRERWPHIRVLLMSGYPEDAAELAGEPAVEILAKPFGSAELVQRVSALFSG